MPTAQIVGYAARSPGQLLEPYAYDPPKLGKSDIRVSITHCGICHTDIHAIDDDYGITRYPFVPGHEIVGHVSALGSAVVGLREGDRVGIGWQARSCMHCEWCLKGEEQLCRDIVPSGVWVPYGGFSTSVIADSRFAYPVPAAMPSQIAAVLMCAGVAVYNPLRAEAGKHTSRVAIAGVGGLGHLAIQFAHALGCEVTALSSSPEKRDEALAFGADRFIDTRDRANLRPLAYEYDIVLCTSSGGMDWEALLSILKKRGRLILVGFPDVTFDSTDLVAHELSITGSFLGNRAAMREMLSFAHENCIMPRIELAPMSRVNEAIETVRENRARYRIVLFNPGDEDESVR